MEDRLFSYDEMQEYLPDYLFGRLSQKEREIFERSLQHYPDIVEEIDNVRKVFSRFDKMNFDRYIERKTRNIPFKVHSKLQNKQKAFGFIGLPVFRIVVGTIGVLIIALSLFWSKNLQLHFPTKSMKDLNESKSQSVETGKSTPIQFIDEAEVNKLLENALTENHISSFNLTAFEDPVYELGKIEDFSSLADNLLEDFLFASIEPDSKKLYLTSPLTIQPTLNELENLNETDFQQLIKELKNVSI